MLPLGLRAQCPADDAANAVLIILDDPDNDGIWTPFDGSGNPITISGNNSGCTDVYNTGAPHNARRGRPGKDVFYRIVLPTCFDSLEVSLCGGATWDTYLHVINATRGDTIDGDDNCGSTSQSEIIAIGRPNTRVYNTNVMAKPVRDTMLLVQGDEIYIVLEGYFATSAGPYTMEVKGYRQRPVSLGAPVISGPSSVCAGATSVTLDAPYPGGYEWRWYENGNLVATTATSSYTIPGPINNTISYEVEVDVLDPNEEAPPTCPLLGTTPLSDPFDITIAGVPADAQEITVSSSTALWGEDITIDADPSDPNVGGTISLEYSTDGGNTWTPVSGFSSFPHTFTFPPLASGGPYTATYEFRTVANAPGCNPPVDYSEVLTVTVSDRPGNRPDNAILITLTPDPANPGHWIAPVISDSTNGPGLSNEYVDPTPGPGNVPRGRPTRDLFFVISLPECLDSLDVSLCSSTPGLLNDTYLHLINATVQDTIDSDDGCATGGSLRSEIRALGLPNVLGHNPTPNVNAKPARDTLLLVNTHTLYVVVEGYSGHGKFELRVRGYKIRPSSITVSGAPSGAVCINSNPITLDATTPGATAYQWLDNNNNPIPGATNATFTVSPTPEGVITVRVEATFNNPNEDPSCAPDIVTSDPVTITVEDTARAQIADASNTVVSGQTLNFTEGDNVTLNVSSPQTSGNSYTWNLYNSIPPSGSPTTSMGNSLTINNIAAGSYTVILEAVRGTGACGETRDTVYLSVTTGLRTEGGAFSIFPNPNTGVFTIVAPAMDTYRVQVLDVAGRLVAADAFTGSAHQMRLSLPAGVYQIRLLAGDKVQVGRLIITE